jgi:hypothetical protein
VRLSKKKLAIINTDYGNAYVKRVVMHLFL